MCIRDSRQCHHHQQKACGEGCNGIGAGGTLSTLDDGKAVLLQMKVRDALTAGDVEGDVQPPGVVAHQKTCLLYTSVNPVPLGGDDNVFASEEAFEPFHG